MTAIISRTLLKSLRNFTTTSTTTNIRYNGTFKAAILNEAAENLEIVETKSKKIKKDEVKIQVHYCSVNSVDCISFRDKSKSLFVPGYELSGEVIEIGKSVTPEQVIVGEKVAALSLEKFGGFANECIVNVQDVFRLPSDVQLKDAAVLICGHSTAYYAFTQYKEPKEDDKIVVTAGPAGLGLAAVDVAANIFKAKVIGVTDSEDRSELLRTCGAFETLKFHPKLKKDILKSTYGEGCNIVYDAVGEYMLEAIGECAKPHGSVFHAAPYTTGLIPFPPLNRMVTMLSLHALRKQNVELYRTIINDILELANQGLLTAHISATFDLSSINTAIKYIEDKKCTGKVLIKMD